MTEEIQLPGDIIQWGEDDLHNALHRKDIEIFQMRKQIDVLVAARNDYFVALTSCQQRSVEVETQNVHLKAQISELQERLNTMEAHQVATDPAAATQALTDAEARAQQLIESYNPVHDEATPLDPFSKLLATESGPDPDVSAPPRRGPQTYKTGPADAATRSEQGGDKIAPLQSAAAEVDAIAEQQVIAPIPILRPREKQP